MRHFASCKVKSHQQLTHRMWKSKYAIFSDPYEFLMNQFSYLYASLYNTTLQICRKAIVERVPTTYMRHLILDWIYLHIQVPHRFEGSHMAHTTLWCYIIDITRIQILLLLIGEKRYIIFTYLIVFNIACQHYSVAQWNDYYQIINGLVHG